MDAFSVVQKSRSFLIAHVCSVFLHHRGNALCELGRSSTRAPRLAIVYTPLLSKQCFATSWHSFVIILKCRLRLLFHEIFLNVLFSLSVRILSLVRVATRALLFGNKWQNKNIIKLEYIHSTEFSIQWLLRVSIKHTEFTLPHWIEKIRLNLQAKIRLITKYNM